MKEEYFNQASSIMSFYKTLGIDAESEIMKYVDEQLPTFFGDQMDKSICEVLREDLKTDNYEKYKHVLIGA